MFTIREISRLFIVAVTCLTIFEACGSVTSTAVSSASITPAQIATVSSSPKSPTPSPISTKFVSTTSTNLVATPTLYTPLPTFQIDNWQSHWLKGVPCKPPCWEKIIPGQTTLTEAENILKTSGLIRTATNQVLDAKATRGQMRWSWENTLGLDEHKAAEGGRIYYDNTGSQFVDVLDPNLYVSYALSDIIKVYGEPEYIRALGFYSYPGSTTALYSMSAVYLTRGFLIDAIILGKKPINVDATTPLSHITFFIPSYDGYSKLERDIHGTYATKYLVKWQGFQDFNYYCRNYDKPAC